MPSDPPRVAKLLQVRQFLRTHIAAADIGFSEDSIIIRRQSDLWNEVATAIAASENGAILHIGVADGTNSESAGLELEADIPITILALPQIQPDQFPEELLWEDLIKTVQGLKPSAGLPWLYRFRMTRWTDMDLAADDGTTYLGRMTVFTARLSL
jgi:hypothetical protein